MGDGLPLSSSLALGAQHGKLGAYYRTLTSLGMPSVQSVQDYHTTPSLWRKGAGWRLWRLTCYFGDNS
jgi:hypothetical protein